MRIERTAPLTPDERRKLEAGIKHAKEGMARHKRRVSGDSLDYEPEYYEHENWLGSFEHQLKNNTREIYPGDYANSDEGWLSRIDYVLENVKDLSKDDRNRILSVRRDVEAGQYSNRQARKTLEDFENALRSTKNPSD